MQRFRVSIDLVVEVADPLELQAAWVAVESNPSGVLCMVTASTTDNLEKDVLWLLAMGRLREGKRGYRVAELTALAREESDPSAEDDEGRTSGG